MKSEQTSVQPIAVARAIKAKAVRGVLDGLYLSGMLFQYLSHRLRSKALVLMYHRVLGAPDRRDPLSHPGIIVDEETFEKHIQLLQRHFKVCSLDKFLGHIREQEPFEDRSCLITFDDGWHDNYTHAFPILKKYRTPAVVFLTTAFIGTDRVFWQERLAELVGRVNKPPPSRLQVVLNDFPELREGFQRLFMSAGPASAEDVYFVCARMKHFPQARIEQVLSRIETLVSSTEPSAPHRRWFITWEEAREMAAEGIDFGSHGVSHAILTVDTAAAEDEIARSKHEIEARILKPPGAFSYPNGNHSATVVDLVRQSGYQAAFGTSFGYVAHNDDPFRIRRVNIHNAAANSPSLFLGRLAGLC